MPYSHYVKTDDIIHKSGSTQCIAMPQKECRATTTVNMHKKFGAVRPRDFQVM